jgi:transcriptional regulator with XRE-family HTH domain
MKQKSVEQSDIVIALGISASTVSDWVNGKKYPRVDAMQRLADFLGIRISDLTMESSEPEEAPAPDPATIELLTIYDSLNPTGQDALLSMARGLASNPAMKKDGASQTETA